MTILIDIDSAKLARWRIEQAAGINQIDQTRERLPRTLLYGIQLVEI